MATHVGVLDKGRLVQFGTPRGSMKTPSASMRPAVWATAHQCPARRHLRRCSSEPAFIGLRPEQIGHGEGEESIVERVEHLGDQTRLHLTFKTHDLITVTDAHTNWHMDDIVRIRPHNPFYFDATGVEFA